MSICLIRPLAAALFGVSLAPAAVWAQGGDSLGVTAAQASVGPAQNAPAAPRSGLWQTVEAEHRRQAEPSASNPYRLSEAERQELRDQIRRASMRTDGLQMPPAVPRP